MVVHPTARRETFKFKMRICVSKIAATATEVSRIVEYGKSRFVFIYRFSYASCIIKIRFNGVFICLFGIVRIKTRFLSLFYAGLAITRNNSDNIEEYAVCVIVFDDLLYLRKEYVEIRRIEAKSVISRLIERRRPRYRFIYIAYEPFGMKSCHSLVKPRRKINGCLYAYFVRRLYLRAQKIKMKIRMHYVCGRRMIRPSVVA